MKRDGVINEEEDRMRLFAKAVDNLRQDIQNQLRRRYPKKKKLQKNYLFIVV